MLKPAELDFDPIASVSQLRTANDVNWACAVLGQQLRMAEFELLSIKFCDLQDEKPAIRPYGAYPQIMSDLAVDLRDTGGCPISKEAQKRLTPFDAMDIQQVNHVDFLSKRFLQELRKMNHRHIAVVPIVFGRGLAVYTVGLNEKKFEGQLREALIGLICNATAALIGQFPEVSTLFEPKQLSSREARCVMLGSNGHSDFEIGAMLGFSEFVVDAIFKTASDKLGAKNRSHLTSRALAKGEISNVQCTLVCDN
jgi:DNA-binding CsgD family transcriptional regulator